eukprot:TRINITY_DN15038_c0_g2_i1.p1 TRINITY_DN15038_c0_g2~~TRINITY_DN15038_c0_g2_i1.p1  ORF type:complete len:421 (-),score=93.59 TRINITY_DN15038_c0_g2_i1:316-1578(-)
MATSDEGTVPSEKETSSFISNPKSKPKKGIFSRIWNFFFKSSKEDFEKKLEHLSKEEAAIHARLKRRSQTWRKVARSIILYSVILEGVFMAFAFIATRTEDLTWQMRALRVFPVFALPATATFMYSTCLSLFQMWNRKDQKTLDKLQSEKHAKLDELKERNNFYTMLQQIQRYDPDPALRDAAARVLASKIGAETGLNVSIQSDTGAPDGKGKTVDANISQPSGLRNRKHPNGNKTKFGSATNGQFQEDPNPSTTLRHTSGGAMQQGQILEHHQMGKSSEGGWISRFAAMLVGEDPSQCYALICGNCQMHNGLAKKEDFPFITYYCPHCGALNGSKDLGVIDKSAVPEASISGNEGNVGRVVEKLAISSSERSPHDSDMIEKIVNDTTSKVVDKSLNAVHQDVLDKQQVHSNSDRSSETS